MKQLSNEIHVQQSSYIKSITPICTQRGRHKTDKITEEESHQLRGLAGQFNWVANQTRPDIAFKARQTSIAVSNSTVGDIHSTNKCVQKLQSEDVVIKFKSLEHIKTCSIRAYSDAALRNLPGGSSQGDFIIFLHGENGNVIQMSWRSRKIKRVVRSTLAAETMAFIEAAEQSFFIRAIISELHVFDNKMILPINMLTDKKSRFDSIHSTKTVEDKQLLIDISCIRNKLAESEIK